MEDEIRVLSLDEIITTQKCLDFGLLTLISWGYFCRDKIKPPQSVKYNGDPYRLVNGNHRAVSQYLFGETITAAVHHVFSNEGVRPTISLKEVGIYRKIFRSDGSLIKPDFDRDKYRPLEEIPQGFFVNVSKKLAQKGFGNIQESLRL